MHLLDTALKIATAAHAGQTDKAGRPYILHPLRVMAALQTDDERAVAVLHDVIEDSDYEVPALVAAGIPEPIAEAVSCLSKREGEDYPAFIARVLENPPAARVKRADVADNITRQWPCLGARCRPLPTADRSPVALWAGRTRRTDPARSGRSRADRAPDTRADRQR